MELSISIKLRIMKILNKIIKWLSPGLEVPITPPSKTLQDLEIFDTIWIKDSSGNILKGWIFDLTKKHVIVSAYDDAGNGYEYHFVLTRPLTQTQLKQNNITLFLEKPCELEK